MPSLPSGISARKAQRALERLGFYFVRQKGSHIILKRPHPTDPEDVIVLPNHKEIDKWTLGDSLKLGKVGIDEFLESL
ncbi:MAG: type II toxin-antitoxin system HicA family toxin [Gemmatimonadetes bacterium]|nr:type II toxin-antitoxin system HicA family toxin [Gemmatimonadota bacterium]